MEHSIKYFLSICAMSVVFACAEDPAVLPVPQELTETERMLSKKWKYNAIRVNGASFELAETNNEPIRVKTSERQAIGRRWIEYVSDKNYQIQWDDRGNYTLGTDGDPNWQPNFGYWILTANEDSLIHNHKQHYEARYKITITEELFIRESRRIMSSELIVGNNLLWQQDEEVTFTEEFVPVE